MSIAAKAGGLIKLRRNTTSTVTRAAVLMTILIGASRIIGLIRNMVIAHYFGQDWQTDCYVAAFIVPDFFYFLLSGGALATGFVPVFTGYLAKGEDERALRTFHVLFSYLLAGALIVIALAWLLAEQLVWLIAPGFRGSERHLSLTITLTRIILPAQFFFILAGLFWGALNSLRYFLVPAIQPILYNTCIIMGGIVGHYSGLGVAGLAWGALTGSVIAVVFIQMPTLCWAGVSFRTCFDRRDEGAREVVRLVLPVIFGLSVSQINAILLPRAFGSMLQEGGTTAIEYANRLMQLPVGLFGMSLAIALFPTLSERAAIANIADFRNHLAGGLRVVLMLTVPCAVLLAVLSEPVIRLLFEHGKFTAHNTEMTTWALLFYCLGIPAMASQQILSRGFYALKDTVRPVIVGMFTIALAAILNYLLIGPLQQGGLALAASTASTVNVVFLIILLARRLNGLVEVRLVRTLGAICLSCAGLGLSAYAVCHSLTPLASSALTRLIQVLLPSVVGAILYLLLLRLFKVEELKLVMEKLRRKVKVNAQGNKNPPKRQRGKEVKR